MRTGRGSYGNPKEVVQLHMHEHRRTPKALLLSMDGDEDNATWYPRSQLSTSESDYEDILIVTMPEWLARKHDLIT